MWRSLRQQTETMWQREHGSIWMKTLFKPKVVVFFLFLLLFLTYQTPAPQPQECGPKQGFTQLWTYYTLHFTTSFFSWFCVDAVPTSQTLDLVSEIGDSDGELDIESFYPNQSIAASPTMTATHQDHFLQYSHTRVSFTSAVWPASCVFFSAVSSVSWHRTAILLYCGCSYRKGRWADSWLAGGDQQVVYREDL